MKADEFDVGLERVERVDPLPLEENPEAPSLALLRISPMNPREKGEDAADPKTSALEA